ncbi:hypothetical protein CYY_008992 [Polysphondylium violaceum]|uniref:Isopentenyl phosphate kinase n=1 Tax=Polysphondylium violaceum TaxID=133409 RepID=A0A8J4PM85_9MYCE|nr:hypothetical protein CYY_008992 [Polysphondylium violaceum]
MNTDLDNNELLVIKFGGAYLCDKSKYQTLNDSNIDSFIEIIKHLVKGRFKLIVLHGAGSFGHHDAKKYKITSGFNKGEYQSDVGICKTRQSVLKLNALLISRLNSECINAVSVSPFDSWLTQDNKVIQDNCRHLELLLSMDIIPILHGDVCLDTKIGCTIISGDILIQTICEKLRPKRAIFITDVNGVYNLPPSSHPNAKLLSFIHLNENGDILNEQEQQQQQQFVHKQDSCDVTGGMEAKIKSAKTIASLYSVDTLIIGGTHHEIIQSQNLIQNVLSLERGTILSTKQL